MADWYVDTTLPQAEYADYATAPVAAGTVPTKPEDGNGKATGPASMATLEVTFTGVPAAGGSITIAGVTFTAVASGATGNQFNAATDAATCATNLRNAINASTTNVVNPTMASCPLRNAVNATSSGGVVTVYTRICGSEWNSVTEAETLTNASITAQWAGGADGAFGYFINMAAVAWPTSVSAGAYGAFVATYLGQPAAGDTVHIRTKRSGADVKITWANAGVSATARAVGVHTAPLTFLADNGVKWAGDAGVFIISVDGSNNSTRRMMTPVTGASFKQIWAGVRLTETTCNWRHEITGVPQTSNFVYHVGCPAGAGGGAVRIQGMQFCGADGGPINNTNASYAYLQVRAALSSAVPVEPASLELADVIVQSKGQASPLVLTDSTSYGGQIRMEDCLFDHTGLTVASGSAMVANYQGDAARYEAVRCRWAGFPAVSNLSGFQNWGSANQEGTFFLKDCEFTNIKLCGGTANGGMLGSSELATTSGKNALDLLRSITVVSSLGNRPFVYENARRSFAWIDSAAPKIATTLLPDGATAFSVRTAVTTEVGTVSRYRHVRFPRIAIENPNADGTRSLTIRILVDTNIVTALGRAPRNDEIWFDITYVGTDGRAKLASSACTLTGTPVALDAGTGADWTAVSYDVNGVTHNYTPYQVTVALASCEGLSEIGVEMVQGLQSNSTDNLIFLDTAGTLT